MRFIIVSGISGAGKSTALKMLEDMGYYCVDNIPLPLIPKMAELMTASGGEYEKVALGLDIRGVQRSPELKKVFQDLDDHSFKYELLFLDSTDDVLIKRFKETRRNHPLGSDFSSIEEGILKERSMLSFIQKRADFVIETSHLLTKELRKELKSIFVENKNYKNLFITVMSFGFKYGIPSDADLVFDVRFLPNPYYDGNLKSKTGLETCVKEYVYKGGNADIFVEKFMDILSFLIPNYVNEGKNQLVICIGCTGGKHRSVAIANDIFSKLSSNEELGIRIEHRDIEKDTITKSF
ncbi:MAG: RNase adapter RapZ [Lachnospiraceae bacterium]|jgi:UPF0042 nucleotide-binding protein|nr:RNase adapter RapZ [Lachnospiraceae bacterium]